MSRSRLVTGMMIIFFAEVLMMGLSLLDSSLPILLLPPPLPLLLLEVDTLVVLLLPLARAAMLALFSATVVMLFDAELAMRMCRTVSFQVVSASFILQNFFHFRTRAFLFLFVADESFTHKRGGHYVCLFVFSSSQQVLKKLSQVEVKGRNGTHLSSGTFHLSHPSYP